jgi:signal transduction histidine kinase
MRAFVYFIQAESTGKIKIGHTDDLPKRMYTLLCASPDKLKLLGKLSTKVATEKSLHTRFNAFRSIGEWFEPSEEILSYIRANCSLDAEDLLFTYKSNPKHRIARKLEAEAAKVAKAAEEVASKAAKEAETVERERIAREEFVKRHPRGVLAGLGRPTDLNAFIGGVLGGISREMAHQTAVKRKQQEVVPS